MMEQTKLIHQLSNKIDKREANRHSDERDSKTFSNKCLRLELDDEDDEYDERLDTDTTAESK